MTTTKEDADKVNETKVYTYDTLGRLIKTVTTDHKKDDKTKAVTYTYDNVGNRLKEDNGTTTTSYTYNGLDQLKTSTKEKGTAVEEVRQYDYDANGNQTDVKNTKTGENQTYVYDAENRLSQVSVTKDGKTAVIQQNIYNGEGQRIQKIDGDETINYYYQDGVVAYTTDTDGNQNSQNLIGTDGNVLATERFQQNATQYYLYNKDIQGSTSSLVKEDGSADATYQYTDFGETTIQGDDQAKNEVSYTGGIYDQSTGLYYLNARYYNPEDGRFLTEDTYRGENNQPNTQHLYVYCANNPVNYVDPSGHGPVGIVIGGLIGYGAGKLILPKIANRLHLKGKKRRWFIRLGTGVTTVLGGMAGNYFGEAIASIYASGGASATTLNTGVAKMFTKYARGIIKGSNRGIGWNIKFKKYTLRIMTRGGGRTNYMRISHQTKGAMTLAGKFSNNRAVTHIKITFKNLVKMIKLIKNIR